MDEIACRAHLLGLFSCVYMSLSNIHRSLFTFLSIIWMRSHPRESLRTCIVDWNKKDLYTKKEVDKSKKTCIRKKRWINQKRPVYEKRGDMCSLSHLQWLFQKLFQSSKLKARTSLSTETWQKRRLSLSFELWHSIWNCHCRWDPRVEWSRLRGNFNTPKGCILYLQISVDSIGNLWR